MTKQFPLLYLIVLLSISLASAQNNKLPIPEETLGFKVGADFKLASYEQSISYFQKLDEASELLEMHEAGKTSEGRPWYFAVVSSKENLANLDHYKDIAQQLAHPADLSEADAKALAKEGKVIVHIDGGLHATEVACAQHMIELAYDILNQSEEANMKAILDNVIIMLWPTINPDGQTMVADWYKSNVGTPYEVAPIPKLYQKYVGHDNNRDAYMNNMIESRVVSRTWREWEPNIIYVHHQSSPFPTRIWLPPFAEPITAQSPPIISREINMIGMAIAQALESNGQEGAMHMGKGFDLWYPGYIDGMPIMQNIAAFFTETALYRYATPYFYTIRDFPAARKDLRTETLYSSPWKGGWWHLRDAVEYQLTASKAVLDYSAKYKDVLLYNRYQAGRKTIENYEEHPPYAYFIPQEQRDLARPVELLRRLAFNGIRISQLTKKVNFDGTEYPAGTWVIPMNQEFAELVRQIFDIQEYPDLREFPNGPPEQPYDAAGWTLPFLFELDITPASIPLSQEVLSALEPVRGEAQDWKQENGKDISLVDSAPGIGFNTNAVAAGILAKSGSIRGAGAKLKVDPVANNSFRFLNEVWKAGGSVEYENGKYLVSGVADATSEQWIKDLALRVERSNSKGGTKVNTRIALYRPSTANMDEGWTRWLMENYGFEFTNISTANVQAGKLKENFDVILLASDNLNRIKNGFEKGSVPPRYEGGLEVIADRNLDEFVKQGGTLVCLNQSSAYAIEALHLPVKNVVDGLKRADYFTGGSILEVSTDPTHPVFAGMPERANVFVWRSPVFDTLEGFKGTALAKYEPHGSPLRSGYLLGEKYLQGYAAALDVHHGEGHVILLGFRPQWRGQTFGTFRVLFNSILYGNDLAKGKHGDPGFWESPKKMNKAAQEPKN
ncbi:MAG: M14 family metallopeptidase [Saprospiraceae bacterium]